MKWNVILNHLLNLIKKFNFCLQNIMDLIRNRIQNYTIWLPTYYEIRDLKALENPRENSNNTILFVLTVWYLCICLN